ncbi:MAG: DUF3277 family protein [Methylococcaceae bacterium]|nr:DUF3277 family protein [Methylococcaceae bacterium]
MGLSAYDSKDVVITFGPILLGGFAEGSKVKVEQNEDSFKLAVGVDGDACRVKTNNRSAKITVTLLQSATCNDLLSAVHNEDILSPSGDGIFPMSVLHKYGTTIVAVERAWIVKPPTVEFSNEVKEREWVFETDALIAQIGGSLPL